MTIKAINNVDLERIEIIHVIWMFPYQLQFHEVV